ncbi:MAG: alpha/beta hydrolase [Archangium sp.]|nr:alpha/beta hydrolase [Archangium sp.]
MKTTNTPDTIVLIHGLWMTPRSWEHWVKFYEAKGFKVLAPTYPGMEGEVENLRADASPIAALTVQKVVDHLAKFVEALPSKPILIGHSFGGTLVQLLLDRGLGAAGVVIGSAPVKGVYTLPVSQIRSLLPVLKNPANFNRAVAFDEKQFNYAFTNTLDAESTKFAFERYAVAAPGHIVFEAAALNFDPRAAAKVDFKKEGRAPLFFITGEHDHIMPPAVARANAGKYQTGTVEFLQMPDRDHSIALEPGWEEVATKALTWAQAHA